MPTPLIVWSQPSAGNDPYGQNKMFQDYGFEVMYTPMVEAVGLSNWTPLSLMRCEMMVHLPWGNSRAGLPMDITDMLNRDSVFIRSVVRAFEQYRGKLYIYSAGVQMATMDDLVKVLQRWKDAGLDQLAARRALYGFDTATVIIDWSMDPSIRDGSWNGFRFAKGGLARLKFLYHTLKSWGLRVGCEPGILLDGLDLEDLIIDVGFTMHSGVLDRLKQISGGRPVRPFEFNKIPEQLIWYDVAGDSPTAFSNALASSRQLRAQGYTSFFSTGGAAAAAKLGANRGFGVCVGASLTGLAWGTTRLDAWMRERAAVADVIAAP